MKLNQRYNMNAQPLISHRLLVSTVAKHRSIRTQSAVNRKPVAIDSNGEGNAPPPGVQESVSTERPVTTRRLLTPGKISADWPFFE